MRSKIFINYRKDDSPWNSVALYQELTKYFPKENIFKDINTIPPGIDFVDFIEKELESCDVLLVLISENWLEAKDKNGNLRLNNSEDFVRLEIATALKRNIIVIPVLFDNAVLPQASQLPDDLKKLARRQFIEIDKTHFETDTKRLAETITSVLKEPGKKSLPRKWLIAGAGILLLAIIAVLYFTRQKNIGGLDKPSSDSTSVTIDTSGSNRGNIVNNFPTVLSEVFNDAKNNFSNVKDFPGRDGLLSDPSFKASNIFQRGDEWAFRFTNDGNTNDEQGSYEYIDGVIQQLLRKQAIKFQKLPFPFKSPSLTSFQYKWGTNRIELTRMAGTSKFYHEIIIYHSIASATVADEDEFKIVSITPSPNTVVYGDRTFEVNLRIHYNLQSTDQALFVSYLELFPNAAECGSGYHETTAVGTPNQIKIYKGEGDLSIKITYPGQLGTKLSKAQLGRSGHVAPNASLWAGFDKAGKVIVLKEGLWDFKDYCYNFLYTSDKAAKKFTQSP